MKFAKELERDCVPEWRIKYLNYKAGKKYVKGVSRAINRANGTPYSLNRRPEILRNDSNGYRGSPLGPRRSRAEDADSDDSDGNDPLRSSPAPMGRTPKPHTPAKAISIAGERQGLASDLDNDFHYGSFVPTPPQLRTPTGHSDSRNTFELPAPAIRMPSNTSEPSLPKPAGNTITRSLSRMALQRSTSMAAAIPTAPPPSAGQSMPNFTPSDTQSPRQKIRRMFTMGTPLERRLSRGDVKLQSFDEVREREREFFEFLDSELDKVENFYRQKEDHAGQRLAALREQLHEMRNRRTHEIMESKRRKEQGESTSSGHENGKEHEHHSLFDPLKSKLFKPGPNSRALQKMPQTPVFAGASREQRRDYTRRPADSDIPYRTAKRKLKVALQEFYRGLELLKSYALLNRTAFRKLNKKYDKAVSARPPYRYMNEKVNKSWFVTSDILDGHIHAVEDLYARYFERGNRKLAAGKLRSLSRKPGDESGSAFVNGLLLGVGAVFTVQGLVYGAELLFDSDPVVRQQTSYLMQIYGGYFLMLYLFCLFCIDCKVWTVNKVNYSFIFEFDPRSHLDWRELAEFPSFFLLLFGLFFWLNFTRYGTPEMYLYYPVVLIFVTMLILFFPAPILRHKARRWFLYSHWRLFFAGLYPVEFRDFFLGDIYCSLTYATCNIELFFCLYAHAWNDPVQCNSNHSRLLGFFSTLPPIWRALQCIRRYHDTKNVFPHLVNCGKYAATIITAVCLSFYRINGSYANLALFIAFATINGVYTSIWDLFMDFSLLQPNSRHRLLRDITALKSRWPYYVVMVLDPILRFSWIFYAIFTHNTQHSTIVSFMTAFCEVTRRGMWTLFRVENEHCANVAQYKASRDVPLPYQLESLVERVSMESALDRIPTAADAASGKSTGVEISGASSSRIPTAILDAEEQGTPDDGTVRRRRADTFGKRSIARIMAEAHKQDFEKRRKPETPVPEDADEVDDGRSDDDDDDDDDDSGSLLDERMEVREAELLRKPTQDREESP